GSLFSAAARRRADDAQSRQWRRSEKPRSALHRPYGRIQCGGRSLDGPGHGRPQRRTDAGCGDALGGFTGRADMDVPSARRSAVGRRARNVPRFRLCVSQASGARARRDLRLQHLDHQERPRGEQRQAAGHRAWRGSTGRQDAGPSPRTSRTLPSRTSDAPDGVSGAASCGGSERRCVVACGELRRQRRISAEEMDTERQADTREEPAFLRREEREDSGRQLFSDAGHAGRAETDARGELDTQTPLPATEIIWLRKHMPHTLQMADYLGTSYIIFNNTRKPFDDPRLREALSLAFDREAINNEVLRFGEKSAYAFVPPGTANYPGTAHLRFKSMPMGARMARAKQLMAEMGYGPNKHFHTTYETTQDPDAVRVAAALQQMWRKIYVDIEIIKIDLPIHYKNLQMHQFDTANAAWIADFNDASNFLDLL